LTNYRVLLRPILLGGFTAGTIDIGAATMINSTSFSVILRAVASGVLGSASFHQGAAAAWLGLALQWFMSLVIAAIFVSATRNIRWTRRSWIGSGVAYGVVIFFVMNYVVVPVSRVGHPPHFTPWHFAENMFAMLLFGLIIAFFARGVAPARVNRHPPNA
jgi:uncharacterized membrane protein YagU involved in acid resistance